MMVKLESEDCGDGWLGEYDSLPLKARLKLLRLRKQASDLVDLKETVVRGQCGSVRRTRSSIVGEEEDECFNSQGMLPGQDHKEVTSDAKVLGLPCFQTSNCSLNDLSSPTSSCCCVVSHGGSSYEGICMTSSISSSEVPSNDRSPGSKLAVFTLQDSAHSDVPPKTKIECNDDTQNFSLKCSMSANSASVQGAKVKHEISADFDDLDNIVLRERRQLLLSRLLVKSQKPCMQAYHVTMPKSYLFSGEAVQGLLIGIQDSNVEHLTAGNLHPEKTDYDLCFASNTSKNEIAGMSCTVNQSSAPSSDGLDSAESVESKISTSSDGKLYVTPEILKSEALPSSIRVKIEPYLCDELDSGGKYVIGSSSCSVGPVKREPENFDVAAEDVSDHRPLTEQVTLPPARRCSFSVSRALNYPNKIVPPTVELASDHSQSVKTLSSESIETGPSSLMKHKPSDMQEKAVNNPKTVSSLPFAICVKTEPVLSDEIDNEEKTYRGKSSASYLLPVKTESTFSMEVFEDKLDHMPLLDRLMLLSSETSFSSKGSKDLRNPNRNASSNLDLGLDVLESVKPISVIRPRKRRRTATNSAETALEEDAPGLLKVLVEKGVSVEEIKLYGEPESDEVIDEAFCEESFAELEALIWKVFSHREPLVKLAPISYSKGSKVTYCVGCLLSLVEQTRYLRSRKWPVEWGWCRDLQAFIFVFQRHNRIVLERPEYGYATYFFELLDSLPVGWQIRRLVTTMKLTSCGRITLLENRPLKVGEDLSEGEARVLSLYGWVPNTGLATMLNYCDRVVHDTNKERDGNEWRLKIARILINGYNGGTVVPNFLSKKLVENESTQNAQVKQEI